MVGMKNKQHHSVVQKVMDLGPVNHRATEQCQVECPEARHLIHPWVTAWHWTSLLWAVGQGQCCPAPWHKHGDAGTEQHHQKTQIHYNSRTSDLGASSQQLPASHTEPPYQTFNWSRSDGKVTPWPTKCSLRTTSLKYSSWKNIIPPVTGISSVGVHSDTATLALATTGCYLSGSSQWALQECPYPNCRVDMPQSKLPCSFQIPANTQADRYKHNCSVKSGKLAKSPEKIKHSQQDTFSPTPFSYQISICWSDSHSTWTYRSFVLYRRATNRLAIRCHTPAVSSVGMALHLFNKTKSRHFISHYHPPLLL